MPFKVRISGNRTRVNTKPAITYHLIYVSTYYSSTSIFESMNQYFIIIFMMTYKQNHRLVIRFKYFLTWKVIGKKVVSPLHKQKFYKIDVHCFLSCEFILVVSIVSCEGIVIHLNMPRKCMASSCTGNKRGEPYSKLVSFPKDAEERNRWIEAMPNERDTFF